MTTFTRIPSEETPEISVDVSRRLSKIGTFRSAWNEVFVLISSNRSYDIWRFYGVSNIVVFVYYERDPEIWMVIWFWTRGCWHLGRFQVE